MLGRSRTEGVGPGRRGFRQAERRTVLGGEALRWWEPTSVSKAWGDEYECWEVMGGGAGGLARELAGLEDVRPSRVDVAWDFHCPESMTPENIEDVWREHATGNGFALGVSGNSGVNTRYVGSPSSARRIRCYRKDLQQPTLAFLAGPVMRVEVVLRDKWARTWWQSFREDPERSYDVAAWHVEQLTGLRPLGQVEEPPPEVELPACTDPAQRLFRFIQQHGDRLAVWSAAGVDLARLAELWTTRASPLAKCRRGKLRRQLEDAGVYEVEELAWGLLSAEVGR